MRPLESTRSIAATVIALVLLGSGLAALGTVAGGASGSHLTLSNDSAPTLSGPPMGSGAVLAGAFTGSVPGGSAGAARLGPATLPSAPLVSGAPVPVATGGPDDLARLPLQPGVGPSLIWTQWQNNVNPDGTPGVPGGALNSTLAGYDPISGHLVRTINLTGHVDGLTADPVRNVLLATANEDANSVFYVVNPATASVVRFHYSLNLTVNGNGGSDSIAIWHGDIYISHSDPGNLVQATVYEVHLDWSTHTARLSPLFWDDSTATFAPAGTVGSMALTDPDTNLVMPGASPRFAGDLATVSQGDGRLIFAGYTGNSHRLHLTQLNLTDNLSGNLPPIDGVAVATSGEGTLYVVDSHNNAISRLITDGWPAGTVFVTEPDDNGNPLLGTLNLANGHITPLGNKFDSPKGLLFVPEPPHQHPHHHNEGRGGNSDRGRGDDGGAVQARARAGR